jgi:hypothetical protein
MLKYAKVCLSILKYAKIMFGYIKATIVFCKSFVSQKFQLFKREVCVCVCVKAIPSTACNGKEELRLFWSRCQTSLDT